MRNWLYASAVLAAIACAPAPASVARSPHGSAVREDLEDIDGSLELELRSSPALASIVADAAVAAARRVQILVSVPTEGEGGRWSLRRSSFRADAEYFYPASAVKLCVAVAALQKLDELRRDDPGASFELTSTLRITERDGSRAKVVDTTLGEEIEKALIISDNDAHNRLYELVGRDELAERMAGLALGSVRITHRLADPSERRSYAFELFRPNGETAPIAQRIGFEPPPLAAFGTSIGTSHRDGQGRLIDEPMSFADKNAISLRDLQDLLIAVTRPDLGGGIDLRLAAREREALVAILGTSPSESRRRYPRSLDDLHRPLQGIIAAELPEDRIRVFGKGGRAYGFAIENAYVVDETTGRSFFVTAVIHANENETINDDQYAYDTVAEPFVNGLGQMLARSLLASRGAKSAR